MPGKALTMPRSLQAALENAAITVSEATTILADVGLEMARRAEKNPLVDARTAFWACLTSPAIRQEFADKAARIRVSPLAPAANDGGPAVAAELAAHFGINSGTFAQKVLPEVLADPEGARALVEGAVRKNKGSDRPWRLPGVLAYRLMTISAEWAKLQPAPLDPLPAKSRFLRCPAGDIPTPILSAISRWVGLVDATPSDGSAGYMSHHDEIQKACASLVALCEKHMAGRLDGLRAGLRNRLLANYEEREEGSIRWRLVWNHRWIGLIGEENPWVRFPGYGDRAA